MGIKQVKKGDGKIRPFSVALACALLIEGIYLCTLSPTISIGDSGELITAAATLGVAHPPGYPLWCLLGKLFTLLPFGDIAFRVNVAVSLYAAASVMIFILLCHRLLGSLFLASLAGLTLGLSRVFWSQAVIAEVYTLNLFMIVTCIYLACTRRYLPLAFLAGLSLGAHSTIFLALPAFIVWVMTDRERPRGLMLFACFCVGLAIFLYLPFRAVSDPPLNWGNPSSPAGFIAHVTRAQYGGFRFPGMDVVMDTLAAYARESAGQFSLLNVLFFIPGLVWAWRSREGRFLTALLVLFGPAYAIALSGLLRGEQLLEVEVFFIPSFAVMLMLVAGGWKRVLGFARDRCGRRLGAVLIFTLITVISVRLALRNRPCNDKRHNHLVYDYGRALLGWLPTDAVVYAQGDYEFFSALYLQEVERYRTDVLVLDVSEPEGSDIAGYPAPELKKVINGVRPIYTTLPTPFFPLDRLVPHGLTYRYQRPDEDVAPVWECPEPRYDRAREPYLDYFEKAVLCHFHEMHARYLFHIGDRAAALSAARRAAGFAAGNYKTLNNLGNLFAERGVPARAVALWSASLEVKPDYPFALNNLAAHYYRQGLIHAAVNLWKHSLAADPAQKHIAAKLRNAIAASRSTNEGRRMFESP